MPSVTFRLPPALHERFVAYCADKDVRPSDVIRTAIDSLMDAVEGLVERREVDLGNGSTAVLTTYTPSKAAETLGLQIGPRKAQPGTRLKERK